jgi:hypothetical protein
MGMNDTCNNHQMQVQVWNMLIKKNGGFVPTTSNVLLTIAQILKQIQCLHKKLKHTLS